MSTRHQYSQAHLTDEGYLAKHDTRQRTLALLRESDYFVDGRLNGDWLDLSGERDETLTMLLEGDILQPGLGGYVGVNDNPEVIAANRLHFSEPTLDGRATWVTSSWADAVQDHGRFPRVRVINFDSCNRLNNQQIDEIVYDNLALAEHLFRTNGTVLLVMNFTLGRMSNADEVAQKYTQRMSAWRDRLNPGNRTRPKFTTYTSKTLPMLNGWLPLGF